MRVLIIALFMLVIIGFLGFLASNTNTQVPIRILQTEYPSVPLSTVVLVSILVGVVSVGIIAIAEGAGLRLENRRLRREAQKLETEINFLRTQPAAPAPREPDALDSDAGAAAESTGEGDGHVASAPMYGEDDDWSTDGDDDVYSGGRAV